jgi:hypothetical protein
MAVRMLDLYAAKSVSFMAGKIVVWIVAWPVAWRSA